MLHKLLEQTAMKKIHQFPVVDKKYFDPLSIKTTDWKDTIRTLFTISSSKTNQK